MGRLFWAHLNYMGRSELVDRCAALHEGALDGGHPVRADDGEQRRKRGHAYRWPARCRRDRYTEKRPWLDALAYSTAEFQKDRRSLPPAMRMVPYVRPANAVLTRVSKPLRKHVGVQAVMLSLHATVLPLVTATVEVAEQVRVRLMGIHKAIVGDPRKVSQKFSGKTAEGEPLKDHRHAFILPLGNGLGGRIDRVLLYTRAPEGFESDEVQAILRMSTELYGRTTEDPIRVMATQRAPARTEIRKDCADERRQHHAISAPNGDHWRVGRGEYLEFLADEIRRECQNHGFQEPLNRTYVRQGSRWDCLSGWSSGAIARTTRLARDTGFGCCSTSPCLFRSA